MLLQFSSAADSLKSLEPSASGAMSSVEVSTTSTPVEFAVGNAQAPTSDCSQPSSIESPKTGEIETGMLDILYLCWHQSVQSCV